MIPPCALLQLDDGSWECVRPACKRKLPVGTSPTVKTNCRAYPPPAADAPATRLPDMFDEWPCNLRSKVIENKEITSGCCGKQATALVEFATCPRGRCSMAGLEGTVSCRACGIRELFSQNTSPQFLPPSS